MKIPTLMTFAVISSFALGFGFAWIWMQLKLNAALSVSLMIAGWWLDAKDELDKIHVKHVRAGKTKHLAYRATVKAKCAEMSKALEKSGA